MPTALQPAESTMRPIGKRKNFLPSILLLMLIAIPSYLYSADSGDTIAENWTPNDTPKQYKNLAEERFSMECDYLDIGGERTGVARELFDAMLVAKGKLASERSQGSISRVGAIERLNSLELEYYLELKELVSGRRNLDKIGRMIVKVRARNTNRGKLSAQAD
jgi:hypothetical protein